LCNDRFVLIVEVRIELLVKNLHCANISTVFIS